MQRQQFGQAGAGSPAGGASGSPGLNILSDGAIMDEVEILPLGSGGEVGRSCVILNFRGRSVMLDCGNHPAKSGLDSLPFFDSIKSEDIDLILITHFHLDHCGALPYFINQTNFKGKVFMTSATKAFYKMVMNDFLRVGAGASDLVTAEWLQNTIDKIETIEYHEEKEVNGIAFQAFNAGHVLGAAMFTVDIAGMKALYTGDFSTVPDRHLLGAEIPPFSPDIIIAESTNGIRELESREERERTFTSGVHEVVKRGGRCLVPVFALGRAQELLLILEEFWDQHKELQNIPIYYASSLAQRCMKLYQTFVSAMNDRVKLQHANHHNPFVFRYIRPLIDTRGFEDSGPCVVLASPGMLQSGLSLELFERWCGDRRNGVIMAGYCVDGTVAKDVLARPREVVKPDGKVLPLRMGTIAAVSFSAHSDGRQTRNFIAELHKVQHVVLVHGNAGALEQLKSKLTQDFKDRNMQVFTTKNQESIRIPFAMERTAKVMGRLASMKQRPARPGDFVSGVMLISGQHSYNIVHPEDVPTFTDLNVSRIQQTMVMPLPRYNAPLEVLEVLQRYFAASRMFGDIEPHADIGAGNPKGGASQLRNPASAGAGQGGEGEEEDPDTTKIHVSHDVAVYVRKSSKSQTTLTITWFASHHSDLLADVTCIALAKLAEDPNDRQANGKEALLPVDVCGQDKLFRVKCFHQMLSQFYPNITTNLITGNCSVELADGQVANILDCIEIDLQEGNNTNAGAVAAVAGGGTGSLTAKKGSVDYDSLEVQKLKAILKRIYLTLFPIPVDSGWCDCGVIHGDEPVAE